MVVFTSVISHIITVPGIAILFFVRHFEWAVESTISQGHLVLKRVILIQSKSVQRHFHLLVDA